MLNLTAWDYVILAIAAYFSIMTLVRLMVARRDAVVARYQARVQAEQQRKLAQEQHERRQKARAQKAQALRAVLPDVMGGSESPSAETGGGTQ